MKSPTYDAFGETDKGLVRVINEDLFLINKEKNLFAIADGLGGLPQGDVASQLAIQTLASITSKGTIDFKDAFEQINKVVNKAGKLINIDFGIGTTLTAITINNYKLQGGHAGDTGVFLFKKDCWIKLTKDHTMAEQMKDDAGESLQKDLYIPDYYNHVLTKCIGKENELKAQLFEQSLEPGDRILLYSDGVTKMLTPNELHQLAFEFKTSEKLVKKIIKEANARGGIDNITAIAIFIK